MGTITALALKRGREKTVNDKTCEECLYCKNGKCFLEILDGSDPEECRGQNHKWFEAMEE